MQQGRGGRPVYELVSVGEEGVKSEESTDWLVVRGRGVGQVIWADSRFGHDGQTCFDGLHGGGSGPKLC